MKMYFIVNKDIEISKGKLSGQVGHASMSYLYSRMEDEDFKLKLKDYMVEQKKIILKGTENQIKKLEKDSIDNNLGYITIRDLGYTELESGTLTCICVGISGIDEIPKITKRLRLLTD